MRMSLVLSVTLISGIVWAEQSADSTGDYATDLGQVYGGAQAVKFMKEICSTAFPAQAPANDAAFKKWREQFLPFLQEVEKHWTALAWQEAKGDPQKHTEFLNKMADHFDGYKMGLEKQLRSDGPEFFRKQCEIYPTYLTTNRTNLEYFYAEQVATIRKGPEKK